MRRVPLVLTRAVFGATAGSTLAAPHPAAQQPPVTAAPVTAAPVTAAPATPTPRTAPPVLHAVRAEGAIRIDGRLDEGAWARAESAHDFVQQWPKNGAPAAQRTEARILYDDQALYIGVRAFDTRPDSIAAQLARRDATGIYSDWIHVVLDSYHDRRTGFRFSVNPKGVQKDVRHFDDGNEDLLWDAVWQVATTVDSLGWTAEYRIPLSQLRYARAGAGGTRVWGLQISRDIARFQERDDWSPIPLNANGYVSRFGDLTGLDALPAAHSREVIPYVSGRLTRAPGAADDPFYRRNATRPGAGADVRLALGAGLTLTGTINPDFGQVELDPALVNLTAFEQFFPERRPFFVEGAEIFRFGRLAANNTYGNAQLFYTRRLGRAPQRSAYAADLFGRTPTFVDAPTDTRILGAAKLSGKTAGGWSVGVLDAVTDGADARLVQTLPPAADAAPGTPGTPLFRSTPVAPRTNTFVGRTRRDFNRGATVVGAVLSHVARDLGVRDRPFDATTGTFVDGPEVFRPILAGQAAVGGVDFEHNWHGREWTLSGYAAGTRVTGAPAAIAALQRAPYRLYQRPDGSRQVDTSATSLGGGTTGLALAKQGGKHWTGSIAYQDYSPGLEVNDAGFGQTADRRSLNLALNYSENTPSPRLRSWGGFSWATVARNYDGETVTRAAGGGAFAQLPNLWQLNVNTNLNGAAYSDRLLRGGPLARTPARAGLNLYVRSDPRRLAVVGAYAYGDRTTAGAWARSIGTDVSMRPSTNVAVTLGPSLDRSRTVGQYVRRVADPLATATYGARYVFADVEQTTASMTARLNWTFTPRLTLETVLQPYVSAGRFHDFKEFTTPRRFDFAVYGRDANSTITADAVNGGVRVDPDGAGPAAAFSIPNQNFTYRSLRGSAVLRWEYRPGSALFAVWQQQREGSAADGRFDGRRDLGALFREPARNVFLVKATYWLSR